MGRDFPPMKALALSLPLLLAGCGSGHEASQSAEPPAVDLPVTTASPAASMDGATASGPVEAGARAQLVARASGTIRAAGLYDGQPVRRGPILATIDARPPEAPGPPARARPESATPAPTH